MAISEKEISGAALAHLGRLAAVTVAFLLKSLYTSPENSLITTPICPYLAARERQQACVRT